jgi:hypothetical protein
MYTFTTFVAVSALVAATLAAPVAVGDVQTPLFSGSDDPSQPVNPDLCVGVSWKREAAVVDPDVCVGVSWIKERASEVSVAISVGFTLGAHALMSGCNP